jgi:hypothetical protein
MKVYYNLITKVIDKYAKTYPDLTDKDLQKAMAEEIMDSIVEHERIIAEKRSHNRVDVSVDALEVNY